MSQILNTNSRVNVTDLKVEHSIGSLTFTLSTLLGLDQSGANITMFVDGNQGTDERIATQFPLLPFLLLGTVGESQIIQNSKGYNCYIPLTDSANIALGDKESLNIELKNLPSSSTTIINSIEYPLDGGDIMTYERKVVNSETSQRKFDVKNSDYILFKDIDNAQSLHFVYKNGKNIKYTVEEIKQISLDFDPVKIYKEDGTVTTEIEGYTSMNLFGVDSIEIFKGSGKLEIYTINS